ncbi:hypothetical protein HF086_016139 [Spodoptera exigua]|uniref:Cytochrome p450 n=1 Tax=Spodoptera exigua TaxID=7107 RepID=A0A922SKH1_SPOEX|nr:hypothetical protein HF086_016139 [Spodoptera exigua]
MILLLVSVVLVFALLLSWISLVRQSRQFNVDGPSPLPLVGNAHLFVVKSTEFLNLVQRLSEKYGKVFRVHFFSTPYVVICHAKQAEELVSSTEHITKGRSYSFLTCWLGQGLLTSTESVMGVCMETQKDSQSEYVKSIEELSAIVTMRMQIPFFGEDAIFNLLPYKTRQDKALKVLHGQTNRVIEARRQELKKANVTALPDSNDIGVKNKHAFLDLLLLAEIDGKKIDDESVREEVDTFMFEEVQSSIVVFCELAQMKYLELVIKESMRLFPPVPLIERRIMKDCGKFAKYFFTGRRSETIERYFSSNEHLPDPAAAGFV